MDAPTRAALFRLSAINSVATEPSLFDFDEVYLSGSLRDDPEKFRQRFMEILAAVDPHLAIPCRDDNVVFLAKLSEVPVLRDRKISVQCSEPAEAMLDKYQAGNFLRHGCHSSQRSAPRLPEHSTYGYAERTDPSM
jgi:hypothetical protein